MMTLSRCASQRSLYRRLAQSLLVGSLSTMGLWAGLVAGPTLNLGRLEIGQSAAYAQDNSLISRYARAVWEVEKKRSYYYQMVKPLMGGSVPDDVCSRRGLPGQVQEICNKFNADSADIVNEKYRLTNEQFNDLTRRQREDPALRDRIRQELLRIQG